MYPKPDKPAEDMEVKPCGDASGTLPSCAPLAVPYVPFQQKGAMKYDHSEALENGTLFPGLNLPFKLKAKAANVPIDRGTDIDDLWLNNLGALMGYALVKLLERLWPQWTEKCKVREVSPWT